MDLVNQGWLEMQELGISRKGWKQRHCVLYGNGDFSCYEDVPYVNEILSINICDNVQIIESGFEGSSTKEHGSDEKSLFALVANHQSYLFRAVSPEQCSDWVDKFKNVQNGTAVPLPKDPRPSAPGDFTVQLQPQYNTGEGMVAQQPMYGPPPHIQQQMRSGPRTAALLAAAGGGGGYKVDNIMIRTIHNEYHHSNDSGQSSGFSNDTGGFDSGGGFDGGCDS